MADGISVLYVDDDPTLLEMGLRYLEDNSEFSVDTARSALVALDRLKNRNYDAIISDFQMPKMNGIELLKRVRDSDKIIPFILFTGRGREEIVIEAINNGVDFYLQKGGDPETQFAELTHQIRQAVLMRRTQRTLAEQEQRCHDLQNANDLIQSIAPDGHFLFVNKKWLDTLGYREEDLLDRTLFDIIHEESLRHCRETFQRVISGENVGIIDAVFKSRDGRKIYVEGMAGCRIVNGTCQYTRGIFKDVTDRKNAEQELVRKNEELRNNYQLLAEKEQALRESELLLRMIFDNANDAAYLVERVPEGPGKYLLVNDKAVRMLGYSKEELLKMSPRDVVPEDIAKRIMPGIAKILFRDGHATFESANRRKDGSIFPIEVSIRAFRYRGMDVDLSIVRDISERKRDMEALRQANKKLSLLSGITRHDIKNQLLALDGFVGLLHKKMPDPAYEHYFSRINRASSQIAGMIQFTKEYDKVGVREPAWQDIRILLENVGRDAAPDQVVLKNDLPANWEVFADPLVARVFFNLVDNAVRHGGKITTIRFSLEERDGKRIIVCADDGNGISQDEKEQIFDLGFGKNTGFGLAISREILDITGISIKETGEAGVGARFEMVVPGGAYRFVPDMP
ncbi:PAS domain S-box protein [Methanoregula sp.]|uniref:PAS domain S-box protein n=1 Tax=Methanoregula sp. TaxID=2052170 RepID=UPI003567F508